MGALEVHPGTLVCSIPTQHLLFLVVIAIVIWRIPCPVIGQEETLRIGVLKMRLAHLLPERWTLALARKRLIKAESSRGRHLSRRSCRRRLCVCCGAAEACRDKLRVDTNF